MSVDDTMAFWLESNGCAKKHSRLDWMPDVDKDGVIPELYRYEECKEVPALHLYRIKGGVHAWPSMEGVGKGGEGRSKDVDATQATLDFWRKHAGL
jgi:poly(3-hydroxybutyrate) depolymerase